MKLLLEKLQRKSTLIALAGLIGLGALFVAPTSEASSLWVHVGFGPVFVHQGRYRQHHYYRGRRHVRYNRWCRVNRRGYRHCYVRRHVRYN